ARNLSRIIHVGRHAFQNTTWPKGGQKGRILRIVFVLRLLLGLEVIEVAEEFVEAMDRRYEFVAVAEMVLAELTGGVAERLQQLSQCRVLVGKTLLSSRQADLSQPGA